MRVKIVIRTSAAFSIATILCLAIACGLEPRPTAQYSHTHASSSKQEQAAAKKSTGSSSSRQVKKKVETASFGAGCFWCVEAVFQELDGVQLVKSGYMGGKAENPTYKQVCGGNTGHAEICQITYDPSKITFAELLEVFWKTHDPTTLNQQGADRGTHYRSVVFYHNDEQKSLATNYKKKLNDFNAFANPVVTEITKASKFYPAEGYHDNYFKRNPNRGYSETVIRPRMQKFRKAFVDKLKKDE